ncbi:DNA repair protein Swi5/Sae3 [Pyrenophora tritici-repentis]|nr:DNA repair protein Swi5/Sae3 [Pyrenophora tritici-repentis]KAI0610254.1 DNA repair protein Swi5/Sae3 [Pyrenophora tritici-repentis]
MAIEKGITEVADSEDELMTSSPMVVSDEAAQDKLCAIALVPSQERQDACQAADCTHQTRVESNANTTADNAKCLGRSPNDASLKDDASIVEETNVGAQDGAHVPTHIGNTDMQQQDADRVADKETTIVLFEDQGEVMPVTQQLSVTGNEQQKPAENDKHAAAHALSDISIEDATHTIQALPTMSTDTRAQASITGFSDCATSELTNLGPLPVTAMQGHTSCPTIGKVEDSENTFRDLRAVDACWPTTGPDESATYAQKAIPSIRSDQSLREKYGEEHCRTEETLAPKEVTDGNFDIPPPVQTASLAQSDSSAQPDPMSTSVVPLKTPQEVTVAELKAQKGALLAALGALPAIQVLMEETASSDAETDNGTDDPTEADIMSAANRIVKEHIKLLHEYNELKDVGQGLMGLIADQRGVRIVEVQEEFGIDAND